MASSRTSVSTIAAAKFNSIKTDRTLLAANPSRATVRSLINRVKPLRSSQNPVFNLIPPHLQLGANNRLTRRAPTAALVGKWTAGAPTEQDESYRATGEEIVIKLESYLTIASAFLVALVNRIGGAGEPPLDPEQEESCRAKGKELATKLESYLTIASAFLVALVNRIGGAGAPPLDPEQEESCCAKGKELATKLLSYVMIAAAFLKALVNGIALGGGISPNFVWFCLVWLALSAVDFQPKISHFIVSFVRLFAEFMACVTGAYGDKSVWVHMAQQFK